MGGMEKSLPQTVHSARQMIMNTVSACSWQSRDCSSGRAVCTSEIRKMVCFFNEHCQKSENEDNYKEKILCKKKNELENGIFKTLVLNSKASRFIIIASKISFQCSKAKKETSKFRSSFSIFIFAQSFVRTGM